MRSFIGKDGLEPITVSDVYLCNLIASKTEVGTPIKYDLEPLLDSPEFIFKHPSLSIEELFTIVGSDKIHRRNLTSLHNALGGNVLPSLMNADKILVVTYVEAELHHRYAYYSFVVGYIPVTKDELNTILRKQMIDSILPTI